MVVCPECKNEVKKRDRKFCNRKCWNLFSKREYYSKKVKLICNYCKGEYYNLLSDYSKFCSIKCASAYRVHIKNKKFLKLAHKIAEDNGCLCLSIKYKNNLIPLVWRCSVGHIWKRPYCSVKRKGYVWCDVCHFNSSRKEYVSRKLFEIMFGTKFPKIKPKWLKNSKGNLMEFDGFCENLSLAFEYNGEQHYRKIQKYHNHKRSFLQQKNDDKQKINICSKNNIKLVLIPYTIGENAIQDFIISQCEMMNVTIPNKYPIDVSNFRFDDGGMLDKCREYAKERGGECLSDTYIDSKTKLTWKCKVGHIWLSMPNNTLYKRVWCAKCSNIARLDLDIMRKEAYKHQGECLSNEYKNAHSKLTWKCKRGHIWDAVPMSIRRGYWCRRCAHMKDRRELWKSKILSH